MNFLISMNNKMYSQYDNTQLIKTIMDLDVHNYVNGAEIYVDMLNEEEKEYCLKLVKTMKQNNWIVQLHCANIYNIEVGDIVEYLEYYNKLALIYDDVVKLTVHPAEEKTLEESVSKTIKTLNFVSEYIKQNNLDLELLIENLNEYKGNKRCNMFQIYEIVDSLEIDGITLDIGHYAYDYLNDFAKINIKYIDKIKNIHLHDINNKEDHHPFYYNTILLEEVVDYFKKIKYNGNVVLEYGLEHINGETFDNKIDEYIAQIEYVSSHVI